MLLCFIAIAVIVGISIPDTKTLLNRVDGKPLSELMEKAREHYRNNEIDSAMFICSIVAEKYDRNLSDTDKEYCAIALNDVGVIDAFYRLDYVSAYNNLARSLDIAVDDGLTRIEAISCLNIAELFMYFYRHFKTDTALEKVDEYSVRGFHKAYEARDFECMGAIVVNHVSFDLGIDTDVYADLFNEDVPDNKRNISYARALVGASRLFRENKFEQTRIALREALPLMNSEWNPDRYAGAMYANIADTYMVEGKNDDAVFWLRKALADADSLGYIDQQLNVLSTLSTLDTPLADDYKTKYLEKMHSVMSSGRPQMISELDFVRTLAKERKKSAELSENRRQLMIWLCVGGGVLLLVLVFTFVVIRLNRNLSERNRSLYKMISGRTASPTPAEADKYSGQSLNDEKIEEIYHKIKEQIDDESNICSSDFTLSKLSATIGVNTTYVSRVINERYGCSFSSLLGEQRIRVACRRLDDPANANLTIEAIARSVGFASRSTFVSSFKKVVGMTPSEYLRAARELLEER